jgi:hypothetical protein
LRASDLPANRESASCITGKSVAASREIEIYAIEETMKHPAAPLRTVCLNLFPTWTRIVLGIAARVLGASEPQSRRIPSLSGA